MAVNGFEERKERKEQKAHNPEGGLNRAGPRPGANVPERRTMAGFPPLRKRGFLSEDGNVDAALTIAPTPLAPLAVRPRPSCRSASLTRASRPNNGDAQLRLNNVGRIVTPKELCDAAVR